MKIIDWTQSTADQQKAAVARPVQGRDAALSGRVQVIIDAVRKDGDAALRSYSQLFDKVTLTEIRVPSIDIAQAYKDIAPDLLLAIKQAKQNIEKFHEAERPQITKVETMSGVTCEQHWRAIETVGLYIPGGTAPLFSSVLMQSIPAVIAGCKRKILCTPPTMGGKIHPAILTTAHLCGIDEVYAVGGAQAIAAMAYGTASIPKVDKIFGPGNAYVTAAKQLVSQDPHGAAIDMPAGPSEVMVIAEKTAHPSWVASDLLAQAEHDTGAQALLVTTDADFAELVMTETSKQLATLPRRAIAEQALVESRIIVAGDMIEAIAIANVYAPEHLILHSDNAADYLPQIQHAGSVFLGATTPESAGDYASGTNHVLPTYGFSRAYSGINVLSFMKSMTVQNITPSGLRNIGNTIITMAEAEGLQAHANAVKIRLET